MPRVLIIGATGYIGSALAASLLRSGHYTVYGLSRSPSKARDLAISEVIPVLGSVSDSAAYLSLIKSEHINTVVDCSSANMESAKILSDLVEVGKERVREGGAKLGFVYTSGMWVHGSSFERVNDLDPVGTEGAKAQPPSLVAWRPKMERDVLAARDVLDTMIVRPALVYGREHTIWTSFFAPILQAAKSGQEVVKIPLDVKSRPGLVHVDDAAFGLHCAVDKLPLLSSTGVHPVFDLVTSMEAMELIFRSMADAVGFKGRVELEAVDGNALAEAMQTSLNGDSSRAEQLLGWQPRRRGFAAGMEVYAKAFVAAHGKE
ncbi:hypothetical protein MMC28_009334 [Mycoblastus sanguinarius]|nr:hypothetical protein [Mycoblastus sanguinarius]